MIGSFVSVDEEPGYYITWTSKHVSIVRKDGVDKKVQNWRMS